MDDLEESVQIDKGVVPCPTGCDGSSGSVYARYSDGHGYCFRCGHREPPSGDGTVVSLAAHRVPDTLLDATKFPMAWKPNSRKVSSETLRRLGTFSAGWMGKTVGVYPVFNQDGELIAQKLRTPDKEFPVLKAEGFHPGDLVKAKLAFQNVWGDRYDRQVIVTEGEEDAKAVVEVLGDKTAVVSLTAGVGNALANLKANYLWLDRFADIVLWFDDDDAGREAMQECAPLFKIGKCRLAKTTGFQIDDKTPCKDASDVLVAGRNGDIRTIVYAATAWKPPGIVNAADCKDDVKAPREKVQIFTYPPTMPILQEMSGGIRLGEVAFHVAGTGVGKSTQIREIIHHLAKPVEKGGHGLKVGSMWFEDTRRDSQLLLMSIDAGQRLQLVPMPDPDSPTFEKDAEAYDKLMLKWHGVTFGSRSYELFDAQTAEWTLDAIERYVRYMAKGLDCVVIVIDPLSFVVQLMDAAVDERRALDLIGGRMAKAAKELNVAIHITHHLRRVSQGVPHEEGAPTSMNELRGSGGLGNSASLVVGWERNSQAASDGWRVVQSRILKPHRMVGRSGLADVLYYGDDGRLIRSPIPFPPIGKPDGGGDGGGATGGFSPAGDF